MNSKIALWGIALFGLAAFAVPTVIEEKNLIGEIKNKAIGFFVNHANKANNPGFEAVFAIAGLVVVAYIVLRQRK